MLCFAMLFLSVSFGVLEVWRVSARLVCMWKLRGSAECMGAWGRVDAFARCISLSGGAVHGSFMLS